MIGRTPEYLGKRIESYDMKMVSIAILLTPIVVLSGAAISVALEPGARGSATPPARPVADPVRVGLEHQQQRQRVRRPQCQHPLLQPRLAVAMWLGRFGTIVPVLALAGNMALKKRSAPRSARCRPTDRCSSGC